MMSEEKFRNYTCYLAACFKAKIKEAQNNKNKSLTLEDDAYKMGYLMALYNVVDDMTVFTSRYGIEEKHIGLDDKFKEMLTYFLSNLSYITEKSYQKRIRFDQPENYAGEFNQLNDYLIDQCEYLTVFYPLTKIQEELLAKFYMHLEPFFQDYEGFDKKQRKRYWKEIVEIAKEILEAFNFQKKINTTLDFEVELNQIEYDYLLQATFLPKTLKKCFFSVNQTPDKHQLKTAPIFADEIRNLCGTQLQLYGFDENYEPSPEGKILESLIDKFFIG